MERFAALVDRLAALLAGLGDPKLNEEDEVHSEAVFAALGLLGLLDGDRNA